METISGSPGSPVDNCPLVVNIALQSSDGNYVGAHQQNLEMYSEGFPTSASSGYPVFSLEENTDVLCLVLQYMHNIRPPGLDSIPFTLLASLADAVEKYKIYSAMEICKTRMMLEVVNHPTEVFFYSTKHNYPALADMAAKLTLKKPPSKFLSLIRGAGLHDDIAFRWLRYRENWMEVLVQNVLTTPRFRSILHKGGVDSCSAWPPFQLDVIERVTRDLRVLDSFVDLVQRNERRLAKCHHCRLRSARWASLVKDKIDSLPKYSEV